MLHCVVKPTRHASCSSPTATLTTNIGYSRSSTMHSNAATSDMDLPYPRRAAITPERRDRLGELHERQHVVVEVVERGIGHEQRAIGREGAHELGVVAHHDHRARPRGQGLAGGDAR